VADALAIFVKSPRAGQVKTRLGDAIGADEAAELYRSLGRQVVEQCVDPARHGTTVWFAPAADEAEIRSWLGDLGVDAFVPQSDGGLGVRMAGMFEDHFARGASRVVVIGSDCPGMGRSKVQLALDSLDAADMAIGPARDGGYYLLGLRKPAPALFEAVSWSTDHVFQQTMRNAMALGLRVVVLPALRDLDTVEDACALGWWPRVTAANHG